MLSDCEAATIEPRLGGAVQAVRENDALSSELRARDFSASDVIGINDLAGDAVSLYVELLS